MRTADDPPAWRPTELLDFLTPWLGLTWLPWWRWWRRWIHRRSDRADVGSPAGGPGTTAAGPVAGLAVTSERESGAQGWISCVPCSGVVVVENAGRESSPSLADGHAIRSGAGKPHSGGMTTGDLVNGVRAAYGASLVRQSRSKSAILEKLGQGWAFTVFHVYGELPSNLRRWDPGFSGNHCAAIAGRDGDRVGWYDPLATQGYAGEWVDVDVLLAAMFDDLYGLAGGDIMQTWPAYDDPNVVDLPNGTKLYADSRFSKVRETLGAARTLPYLGSWTEPGYPVAHIVVHGAVAEYLKAADMPAHPYPRPTPAPPPAGDYDEGYAAGGRDEWDRWAETQGIPDRPA